MDFWAEPCNADAARALGWRIAQLMNTRAAWRGIYFSSLLTNLYEDPACIPRWESRQTKDDRARHAAFWKMCRLLAHSIAASDPDRQINVKIPKRDDQRRADEWQAEHNRDNNEKRSARAQGLAEMIREQYEWLKNECPDWTDAEVRTRLQVDFGVYATKGNDVLSRDVVNKAIRGEPVAAA